MHDKAITREGLAQLTTELERLRSDGRRAMAARLHDSAATEANPAENVDYALAREDQALLERRIALLEERVRSARVVEPQLGNGRVDLGERVHLRALDSDELLDLELVGRLETDPAAGRISVESPLGSAIVGRRRGDVVDVHAPAGHLRFAIVAVEAGATAG